MKKTMIAALLLLIAVGASAQCETSEGGTASVKIYRAVKPLLEGKFSVSNVGTDTAYVHFAKGNLKYQASTKTWDFHEHQYDNFGESEGNETPTANRATQSKWIDLFGCCTSGWSGSGAVEYQPWATSTRPSDYGPPAGYSAVGEYAYCDWGRSFYAGYRLLTAAEWIYIIYTRRNHANLRGAGTLFGKHGVFFLPDGWDWNHLPDALAAAVTNYDADESDDKPATGFSWTPVTGTKHNMSNVSYSSNVIANNTSGNTLWNLLETAGVVFLPSGGYRVGEDVTYNDGLHYWTSTADGSSWYLFYFRASSSDAFDTPKSISQRHYGRSVRLVKDVE